MRVVLALLALAAAPWPASALSSHIGKEPFGTTADGTPVTRITMTNDRGMRVSLVSYGATLTALEVPDRAGRRRNVALSLPSIAAYEKTARRWGGIIGRYAGRIGNASFRLDGITYHLEPGRNGVTLHGGANGYDRRIWQVATASGRDSLVTTLTLVSPDGDQGFPGRLNVSVTYRLMRRSNTLSMEYRADTDVPTVFNPTNHLFINLAGAGNGTIDDQLLSIAAERYAEVDERKVPTGRLTSVRGTVLDFRAARPIAASASKKDPLLASSNGFDHSYVVTRRPSGQPIPIATLYDPSSGRRLVIASTEPSVQLNSGNGFDGSETGPEGVAYAAHAGVAIEAQHLPDSPNRAAFPTTILRPEKAFGSTTEYRFGTVN